MCDTTNLPACPEACANPHCSILSFITMFSKQACLTNMSRLHNLCSLLKQLLASGLACSDSILPAAAAGNINQLILKVDSYARSLQQSQGIIAEFVNPKYKDASKTEFKSSTRLECMMQDYPKALPSTAAVGFTVINQVGLQIASVCALVCTHSVHIWMRRSSP